MATLGLDQKLRSKSSTSSSPSPNWLELPVVLLLHVTSYLRFGDFLRFTQCVHRSQQHLVTRGRPRQADLDLEHASGLAAAPPTVRRHIFKLDLQKACRLAGHAQIFLALPNLRSYRCELLVTEKDFGDEHLASSGGAQDAASTEGKSEPDPSPRATPGVSLRKLDVTLVLASAAGASNRLELLSRACAAIVRLTPRIEELTIDVRDHWSQDAEDENQGDEHKDEEAEEAGWVDEYAEEEQPDPITSFDLHPSIPHLQCLKCLRLGGLAGSSTLELDAIFVRAMSGLPSLTELDIYAVRVPSDMDWGASEVFRTHPLRIESLLVESELHHCFVQLRSLRRLYARDLIEVDVLAQMTQLESLTLVNDYRDLSRSDAASAVSQLTNLTELEIQNEFMRSQDIAAMVTPLTKLRHLTLRGMGHLTSCDFLVHSSQLQENLRTLRFRQCLNGKLTKELVEEVRKMMAKDALLEYVQ
jgi:hypothetical protein